MAFPDYDYDIFEDFEDATLATGLTENDAEARLTVSQGTTYYAGAAACKIIAGGDSVAYVERIVSLSTISIGFWFRTSSLGDTVYQDVLRIMAQRYGVQNTSGQYQFYEDYSETKVNISVDTWYWIAVLYVQNGTSKFSVYDTSHSLVAERTFSTANTAVTYVRLGDAFSSGFTTIYYDNYVIDETDATYPLLGWETGAAPSSIPAMMGFYRRLRAN